MEAFQRAIDLYRSLADCDLTNLSHGRLASITKNGKETAAVIDRATGFNIEASQQPVADRNLIVGQMRDRWEQDFEAVTPVLAYVTKTSDDFARLEREARGTLSTILDAKKHMDVEITTLTKSMNDALSQVRDAAKEAGVSKHSIHFKDEADYFRKASWVWLGITVDIMV